MEGELLNAVAYDEASEVACANPARLGSKEKPSASVYHITAQIVIVRTGGILGAAYDYLIG